MKELMLKLMDVAGICKLHAHQIFSYGTSYLYAYPIKNAQHNINPFHIGPFLNRKDFIRYDKRHDGCCEEYLLQYALKNKCCVSFYDDNFNKKTLIPEVGSLEELQIYVDLNMKGSYEIV